MTLEIVGAIAVASMVWNIYNLIKICLLENKICYQVGEPINKKVEQGKWIPLWQACDPDTSTYCECSVCGRYSERPVGTYCKWCGSFLGEDDSDEQ